jgi:hypothetical protein
MRNILLIILVLVSCSNKDKDGVNEKVGLKKMYISISKESNELILETIIDTNKVSNTFAINQKLIFKKNSKFISEKKSPILNENGIYSNEDSITVLDNIIYEIGLLEGSNGFIYSIYGAGSCNACPELYAFYNQMGNCIWLIYSNKNKLYKSIGNFNEVCKNYGIDTSDWYNKVYRRKSFNL